MLITSATSSTESLSSPNKAQTLREIREQLGPTSSAILVAIEAVFDLPDSAVGLLSICSELVADIQLRGRIFPSPQSEAWLKAIEQLRQDVRTVSGFTDAQDRSTANTLKLPLASILLNYPAISLHPLQEQSLRSLRAALCLWHLNAKRKLPREVATSFVRLLKSRSESETQAILSAIPTTSTESKSLRAQFDPASKAYQFLSHIDLALSEPLLLPPSALVSRVQLISKPTISSTAHVEEEEQDDPPSHPKQTNTTQDLISANLSRITFARPKELSGVIGLPDLAQPAELISAFSALANKLYGHQRLAALGAMLTALCNARPRQFGLIPLRRVPEHAIWLDLETGHICWILEAVTSRKRFQEARESGQIATLTVIRTPIPKSVFLELYALFAERPFSQTLADLFPNSPEELDKDVKRLLRQLSQTSHHLTIERLRAGYGTFLVGLSQDEAISSAMSMNFCLGTPANLNYWPLRAKRISEIARKAYAALGLTDELWSSPAVDTGSAQLDCEPKLRAFVTERLQEATDAFRRIHLKSSPSELIRTHNTIATSIFALMLLTTGHRKTCEAFAHHALDLDLALAIVGDKRTSPYHWARVVALPSITVGWLHFYFDWLALLRYRLSRNHPALSQLCNSLLSSPDRRAHGPLFFVIDRRHRAKPLGTKSLRKFFAAHGLPENAGRHWVCITLVDAGYDSAAVMAQAGRAAAGQEAMGTRSALDPMTVTQSVREVLDKALAKWQLPSAPRVSARHQSSSFDGPGEHVPYAFRQTPEPEPMASQLLEHCPFSEFTLANSARFVMLRKQWLGFAQRISLGSLAASLIFLDGVVEIHELTAAVRGLLTGPIYHHDDDFFLDSETRQHGIRRTWLHPATLVIAAKASEMQGVIQELDHSLETGIEKELRPLLAEITRERLIRSPLTYLTGLARDFVALRAPGILRAWWFGELPARTTRPECVARHKTNCIEHPRPSLRTRRPRARDAGAEFIHEAIRKAINDEENRGSNPRRMKALQEELAPYTGHQQLGSPYLELLLSYVVFLTDQVEAPSSIPRYITPVNDLIRYLADHLDSADSIQEAPWQEAVSDYVRKLSGSTTSNHTAEIAALNHLLDCFGIDRLAVQPIDKAAPARRYADQPSTAELTRALGLVSSLTPPTQNPLVPETLLSLAGNAPLRWGEVSRTRTIDFDLGPNPHTVITHAAIGKQKSPNAYRILTLSDPETIERTKQLIRLRSEQFTGLREVFLASASNDPRHIDDTDGGADIVAKALWHASGSAALRPHDMRGLYLSTALRKALDPLSRTQLSMLELRQSTYCVQVAAGHGDVTTTAANYITGFDELRRAWMDHWLTDDGALLSPNFVSSLSDIPADTLRTRSRRKAHPLKHDPKENFDLARYPQFKARVRNLADFIVLDCSAVPIDAANATRPGFAERDLYFGLRLVGQSVEAASLESGIRGEDQDRVEQAIHQFQVRTGSRWLEPNLYSAKRLRLDPLLKKLSQALGGWHPLPVEQFILQRAFAPRPEQPWTFDTIEDIKTLANLWMHIESAGLLVISAHDESNPRLIERRLAAKEAGITKAKTLAHRNFGNSQQVKVSFIPKGTTVNAIPRNVGWSTFLVSVVTAASFQ